jgi:hypothetical protein
MLYEEIEKFENLTNKKANDFSIAYVGGYLDGYEKGKEDAPTIDPSFITDLSAVKDWRICGYRVEDLVRLSFILRDKDIDELNLKDFNEALTLGYLKAYEEFNKALEESIKCIKEAADND